MAIQTQGFQFQNLARYTPVDPTLVGVDFSRIGSGIADAMKLGSSLQQYQMRKQAMEEEAATRESRIAQANAVARLNAARATEALTNVTLMEEQIAQAARTAKERDKQIEASGILRFGPEADVSRARATIALTPEQTALNLRQIQGELATLPLTEEARKIALARQIAADRSGILTDEQVKNMSMQQMVLGLAAGGLKLSHEQAQIYNTEADTRLKNAQALAAAAGKSDNPLPIWKEFNDQINLLETRGVPDSNNTLTNLLVYEGRMAARARGEKEGIFRSEIKTDPILDKRLEELNKLRKLRDDYAPGAGGRRSISSGGLSGGGMAAVTPPALGEVPAAALPALAEIANLGVTTPSAGIVAAAPALAQLFSGGGQAAPAAAAPVPAAPVATVTIGKDGKITRDKGATETVTELAKDYGTEAATALALLPTKQTRESVKQLISRGALRAEALGRLLGPTIAERASQIGTGAIRAVKPAAVTNLADIYLGRIIGGQDVKGMRASEAIGAALASDTEGMVQQERIAGLLDQIDNVLRSNLSRDEKLARARELQGRIDEIRASKGSALIFSEITPTAP